MKWIQRNKLDSKLKNQKHKKMLLRLSINNYKAFKIKLKTLEICKKKMKLFLKKINK